MFTFTTLLVLVALLVLVNVGQADAFGYGDPANFVLRTNANGGDYRVGYPLDWMVRDWIVALWIEHRVSYETIARITKRSKSVVGKIVKRFVDEGTIAPKPQNGAASRPPKLRAYELIYLKVSFFFRPSKPDVERGAVQTLERLSNHRCLIIITDARLRMQWIVNARPSLTLAEIRERFHLDWNVEVSEPTICRALKYIARTRKKKTRAAYRKFTDANLERTRAFMRWQEQVDGENCVFVDEMGIRAADAERGYARSKSGTKAVAPAAAHNTGERGELWNFMCALDADGMLDCPYCLLGSVNGVIFETWCREMLIPTLQQKYPLGGMTIVMDNASFHRKRRLEELFEGTGVALMFLPAYSPEFNPIETAFAWVKGFVRRNPIQSMRDIPGATFGAIANVNGALAKSWMVHSNFRLRQ